eukprot:TRINITY_DN4368_c0_g2_i1.p1 TRINITY_DN4368_c0_g2~~TRINITY_DN4368_c0_g2_i1.p1  ORF type:complete len:419 (+),score=112.61 TRINITY_DN4368_c0_g2_i1:83-1339(+)
MLTVGFRHCFYSLVASSATNFLLPDYVFELAHVPAFTVSSILSTLTWVLFSAYVFRQLFEFYEFEKKDESVFQKGKPRRLGRLPPPFPNGWYRVCDSDEIKIGQVKEYHVCALSIVVYRGEDGKIGCLDAYCPHLGASLGGEGGAIVVGNCVRCPFHGWCFDREGKCVDIPYSKKIPDVSHTRSYPILERHKMIMVWFHVDGTEPEWFPPEMEGIEDMNWHGRTRHHVAAHVQELPENGADTAHLNVVHSSVVWSSLQWLFRHAWDASPWAPQEKPNEHLTQFQVHEHIECFGRRVSLFDQSAAVQQVGPGLVYLNFDSMFGRLIVVQTTTPLAPLHQVTEHAVFAERKIPRVIAKFWLDSFAKQFERDVPIWDRKKFNDKPVLVREDGNIAAFRRWYRQFYSDNSGRFDYGPQGMDW